MNGNNSLLKRNVAKVGNFLKDDEAATAAEYGILAALIAVVIIGAVRLLGTSLTGIFNYISGQITSAR